MPISLKAEIIGSGVAGKMKYTMKQASIPIPLLSSIQPSKHPNPQAGKKHSKGYTLLELMVVLVLLGMFLSFIAPKFRDAVLTDNIKKATLRLIGKIRGIRSDTIQKHKDLILKFDLAKNEYWHEATDLTAEGRETNYEKNVEHLPPGVRITSIWTKGNEEKMAEKISIKFTKKGYSQQAAIYLESDDRRQVTIVIRPFLPKIKVMEGYIEFENTSN